MSYQRKAPLRPRQNAQVSQCYNDGVVTIYDVRDEAVFGFLPSPVYQVKTTLAYQERKLGIKRYYDARQNQVRVERVIRVPRPLAPITSQDVAVTEDGQRYRIDLVQSVPDVYPPSLDLTLAVFEQNPEPVNSPAPEVPGGGK